MTDKIVFSVPWFDILERPVEGSSSPYYVLRTSDYVSVLAATKKGSLLLVQQFRPAVGEKTLELPSGNVEIGESPEQAARRELTEETGYEAERFELLGTLTPDPGRLANKLWCFYAGDSTPVDSPHHQEQGLQLILCEPCDVMRYIRQAEFNNALHLSVLLLAALKGRLQASLEIAQSK
jgi:ADP-ribose pyrophosphatase